MKQPEACTSQNSPTGKEGPQESIDPQPATLTMRNTTLRSCIRWAYSLKDYQVVGPEWVASARYDIVAKSAGPVATADLRRMLQALLSDRFQLTVHRDTKELPVYALVVGKSGPKLQAAAGDGKATLNISSDARLAFRNTSMAELADRLSVRPFGLDHPVLDKTGLSGSYDFTLKFADSIMELKQSLARESQEPGTYASALADLGLKLEGQRGPVELLVVDHAEKAPTEN